MNRKQKRILISTLSIIPILAVASTVVAVEFSKKNTNEYNELSYLSDFRNWKNLNEEEINENEEYLYYFNDNYYSNYNEIINSFLRDNKDAITSNLLYIGSPTFDKDNAIMNMKDLREYNRSKIIPAYQKANSLYTSDKSLAKSSYINENRFITKYTDFNGNLFDSEKKAEDSIRATKIHTPILYYDLPDGTKINPLSKTDLNEFKKTLYKNFREYLYPKTGKDTNVQNSNFSLSIYDFASENNNEENKEKSQSKIYTSLNSQKYLNNSSYFKNIIKDVLVAIYKEVLNYLAKNVRFDIELIPFAMTEKGKIPGQSQTNSYEVRKNIFGKDPRVYLKGNSHKWRILEHRFDKTKGYKEPIVIDSPRNTNLDLKKSIPAAISKEPEWMWPAYSYTTVEEYIKDPFNKIDKELYYYIMDYFDYYEYRNTFSYNSYTSDLFKEKNIVDSGIYATDFTKEDKIIFPDCNISDISEFDVFLSDSKFTDGKNYKGQQIVSKKEIKNIEHWKEQSGSGGHNSGLWGTISYSKEEIAEINILGSKFIIAPTRDINYVRNNAKGFNSSFFHIYNNKNQVNGLGGAFAINLRMSKNSTISEESLFKHIGEKINSVFISDSNKSTGGKYSSSTDIVVNQLFTLFKRDYNIFAPEVFNMINNENWTMSYTTNEKDLDIPNTKNLHSLANDPLNIDRNNQFLFSKTIDSNKYLKFTSTKLERSSTLLDGVEINYDAIMNEIVGSSTVKSNLDNDNFRIVIEYNNNPLFKIEEPIKFESKDATFESTIKKYFFKNETATQSDLDKMKNFSQNFMSYKYKEYEMAQNSKNYFNVIDETNKISFEENSKEWRFSYKDNDGYTDNYISPSLKNKSSSLNSYKINAITDVYNRILRQNKNKDINDVVSPDEVIFLYNEFPGEKLSPVDLKYREFMSNGINQALSIYHDQNVKLFDNQRDLDYFIQNNLSLTPGEVNIFINEDGVPMNPGIKLTDDKKLIPISDAIYDTKENIFDNLNRTFIVPVSDEYVYYVEESGKHTLVSNQLNRLYRLRIKRKNSSNDNDLIIDSYFNSYENCWKALNDYITTKTKVAKIIKK